MYVTVSVVGTISFRFDYRLNCRRETLTLGRYGSDGISLAVASERCVDARRAISEGRSPVQQKQREKRRLAEAQTFQDSDRWATQARMGASPRSMRMSVLARDILPACEHRMLTEITADDLRARCATRSRRAVRRPPQSRSATSSSRSTVSRPQGLAERRASQLLHRAWRDPRRMKLSCNCMAASGPEVGLSLVPRTRISVGPAASRAPRTVAWRSPLLSTHFRLR